MVSTRLTTAYFQVENLYLKILKRLVSYKSEQRPWRLFDTVKTIDTNGKIHYLSRLLQKKAPVVRTHGYYNDNKIILKRGDYSLQILMSKESASTFLTLLFTLTPKKLLKSSHQKRLQCFIPEEKLSHVLNIMYET